jgi:hypothetical protein
MKGLGPKKRELWGNGQPSRSVGKAIPFICGVKITCGSVEFIALIPSAQTEVCATWSLTKLWRVDGEDHDSG